MYPDFIIMIKENNQTLVLVTGGTGFVGIHAIHQLLQKGYQVKTTIRSLDRKKEILAMLKTAGIIQFDKLKFIEADLTRDANWDEAVKDCDYVLHIASPIHLKVPKDENEMIKPAVEGTFRVLKAARNAGVKRVVMTSNFGAVGYSNKDNTALITEESWTDPAEKGLSAYNKSKVLAERAAWNFIKTEGRGLELAVINPMGIFGPSFNADLSSGYELLKSILDGTMKTIPDLVLGIVDVRDVADLHIRAMTNPAANGQRFIALAGGTMSLPQISLFLKRELPEAAKNASTKILPDWLVRLAAIVSPKARAIAPMLGINRNASNEKARKLLGWQPRTNEQAVLAAAESLLKYNLNKI
ncbi:nucleoside-diphosphate-sugar epimerase [Pedobacter sp. UYP1]